MRALFALTLLFFSAQLSAQPREVDLRTQWQVYQDGQYLPFHNKATQSVHIQLNSKTHGGLLFVTDRREFSVFIDGQLGWRMTNTLKINTDSLLRVKGGAVLISIFQEAPIFSLQTKLVFLNQNSADLNVLRPLASFSNFIVLVVLFLLFFFVALFRANGQLMFDYLNVIKLLSLQERDEATVTGRIGASINILYFAFVSFLFSFLMLVLFHYSIDRFSLSTYLTTDSAASAFGIWFILSVFIFVALLSKLVLIFISAQLFGLRDTVRFQFFHFIRLLFIVGIGVGLVLTGFYIFGTRSAGMFAGLLIAVSLLVLMSIVFLFLKLLGRTGLPVFHLFSYLCASEIIPLIILGRVLLF